MRVLLFPGQGSQRVGMGRDLAHEYATAKAVFDEADDALGFAISKVCFDGPKEDLTRTENTQPAILANSIAVLRTLEAERDLSFDMAAGHSLGEWTALVAAGALSFADAIKLVRLRGQAMQEAVAEGEGAMAAIMGMEAEALSALCEKMAEGEVVSPANLNGANQIVISGATGAVGRVVASAKEHGAKRAVLLDVSAPFHCALMQPAADKVKAALDEVSVSAPKVPVFANVDAAPNQSAERVKELLVAQVTSSVRWEESVQAIAKAGATSAIELGSGSVLRGLVRRIAKELPIQTVGEPHEITGVELT